VADVLPGAHELEVHCEINEDWIPVLRIRRVLDAGGRLLFDVEEGAARRVEDMVDEVNVEYLDRLLDLTGDQPFGRTVGSVSVPDQLAARGLMIDAASLWREPLVSEELLDVSTIRRLLLAIADELPRRQRPAHDRRRGRGHARHTWPAGGHPRRGRCRAPRQRSVGEQRCGRSATSRHPRMLLRPSVRRTHSRIATSTCQTTSVASSDGCSGALGTERCRARAVPSLAVFVSDLRHFLDMPDDAPGPARRMADRLTSVVRSATAGDAGATWVSALRCDRRPGRRPCPGHIAVVRTEVPPSISWQCTSCGDDGVISGWEQSPYDLRSRQPRPAPADERRVVIPAECAATLRSMLLLDTETERLIFRAEACEEGVVLSGSDEDLDELLGFVAAEAGHEENRRRQRSLDAAYEALTQLGSSK
jgi:hypothetical protein